jgi:hypothetical protein
LAYCLHVTLARRLHALAAGLTPRAVLEKFAAVLYIPFSEATPKHVVRRGRTPALTEDQARRLLASIKVVRKVVWAIAASASPVRCWITGSTTSDWLSKL